MNIVEAKTEAQVQSLDKSKPIFVSIDPETGDCTISRKQIAQSCHAYQNGNEIPLPQFVEKIPTTKGPTLKEITEGSTVKKTTTIEVPTKTWNKAVKILAKKKESMRDFVSRAFIKEVSKHK